MKRLVVVLLLALSACITVTSPCLEWAPAVEDTVRTAGGQLDTVPVMLCTKQGTPK
jgi:hypothetical protein